MASDDYELKSPSTEIILKKGNVFFIDITPQEKLDGRWGDFSATGLYKSQDDEQISFIQHMQTIHQIGISHIHADMKGSEVFDWFKERFDEEEMQLIDPRSNVGHSIGYGTKQSYDRFFLDSLHQTPMGRSLYAIEPGGVKGNLVARFEDCIYVPPSGSAVILGRKELLPIVF